MGKYAPTIGLEIHSELKTKTKMFCDSANDPNEKHPNINICPVCMGHPGTLPVANEEAAKQVIRIGLALGGNIPEYSRFDRKNYFYPDLPKGYQISQYKNPFVEDGILLLPQAGMTIRINRVHLEEDAGRLIHVPGTRDPGSGASLVDYNRAGVPLMEMVTEPDMHSSAEAKEFAAEFQRLLKTLGASDADMEKGQLRLEANISIAKEGNSTLGTKVEVKNLNSFKALERAIEYEIKRQAEVLDSGGRVLQETRGWDDEKQKTVSQRSKEEAHDYRYFPEPDLPPIYPHKVFNIEELRASLPELPHQRRERLMKEYNLSGDVLELALDDGNFLNFIERSISELYAWDQAHNKDELRKLALNYIASDLRGLVKEKELAWDELLATPENFAELIKMAHNSEITSRVAKDVLKIMVEEGLDPSQIVESRGLKQVNDTSELGKIVEEIIVASPEAVVDYKSGKGNALQFLVGQIMKKTRGSANPQVVSDLIKKMLD